MQWYLFICGMLALIYVMWNISRTTMNWKRFAVVLMMLVLWFFAAFRASTVGADTGNYRALFEQLREMSPSEALTSQILNRGYRYSISWEPGFRAILYIFLQLFYFLPPSSAQGFISFLTLLFLYWAAKEQSPYPFLTIWLYLTLGFFQTNLNMAQNGLTISVLLWGIRYIRQKKPVAWCALIGIMSLVHMSAMFFLPMYWLSRHRFTKRQYWILMGIVLAMGLVGARLISLIENVIPNAYRSYLKREQSASSEVLVLVLHIVLTMPAVFLSRKVSVGSFRISSTAVYLQPYFSFFIVEIVLYLLAFSTSSGLLRGATMFSPVLLVYLPNILAKIHNNKDRKLLLAYIVGVSLAAYILRMSINNIGLTQPYSFMWTEL